MNKSFAVGVLLAVSMLATGCAEQKVKPETIICPIAGGAVGVAVANAGLGGHDAGPMAGAGVVGALLGYYLCRERPQHQ